MGQRVRTTINMIPGPGQYDSNDIAVKTSVQTATINQAERQDLWSEQKGADMPGPGNYTDQKSTFGQTHNAPTMGARIEERINMNPGPG